MTIRHMALTAATLLAGIAIGWMLPRGTPDATPAKSASTSQPPPALTRAGDRGNGPDLQGRTDADAGMVTAPPIPNDSSSGCASTHSIRNGRIIFFHSPVALSRFSTILYA